jgi:phage shock protein C
MIVSEEIVRLHQLLRRGILTDAEFTQAKARLLAEPEQSADPVHWLGLWRCSRGDCWLSGVCGGLGKLSGIASWI